MPLTLYTSSILVSQIFHERKLKFMCRSYLLKDANILVGSWLNGDTERRRAR